MIKILKLIYTKRLNLLRTIFLNFKALPFKQAIKLPIFVYGKWGRMLIDGEIIINSPIKAGMIHLGFDIAGYVWIRDSSLKIKKDGKIIFQGSAMISQGTHTFVKSNATLTIGNNVQFGDSVKIICYKSICIGEGTGIAWESQIMDFNSHFVDKNGSISNIYKPISLGRFNWIGNRSTIMPGVVLPDRVIVTSNSLLNKNYVAIGIMPFSLMGGIPAKFIMTDVRRIFNSKNENFLKTHFLDTDASSVSSDILNYDESK